MSLRFHFDPTSISLRFHFGFTSISLRIHFDLTSISLRSLRFHFEFTSGEREHIIMRKGKGETWWGKREKEKPPWGKRKRERGFVSFARRFHLTTRTRASTHERTNETKRFPSWTHPPTSDNHCRNAWGNPMQPKGTARPATRSSSRARAGSWAPRRGTRGRRGSSRGRRWCSAWRVKGGGIRGIGGFGGGSLEHPRQWLRAQWADLFLGVPNCREPPGAS